MKFAIAKNFEETNYLIYLVKNTKNNRAWNQLWNQYHKLWYWYLQHNIQYFNCLNGEMLFLRINIYQTFYEAIIHFKYQPNVSFKKFFLQRLRWKMIDLSNEILKSNQKLPFLNLTDWQWSLNSKQNQWIFSNQSPSTIQNQIYQHINKFSVFEQKVLNFRLEGLKNREIAQILLLTNRQIANTWERVKKKLKRYIILKKSI